MFSTYMNKLITPWYEKPTLNQSAIKSMSFAVIFFVRFHAQVKNKVDPSVRIYAFDNMPLLHC